MLQQLIQWARDLKTERPQPNQSFQIQSDVEMNWNDIPWKYRLDEIQTIKFDIFDMFSNINVQSFCWHHIQTESINQLYVYSIGYIVDQFSSESDWVTWIHRSKTISSYCKTKCCCYIAVCLFHFIDSVRELLESFRKTCVSFTLFQRGSSRWMLPSIRCQKPANSFSIPSIFYWQVNVPVEPFFSWRFHVDWNLKVAFLDGTH